MNAAATGIANRTHTAMNIFICSAGRAEKILHLECEFMEEIIRHLYDHHRFTLECAGSVLMGMCESVPDITG